MEKVLLSVGAVRHSDSRLTRRLDQDEAKTNSRDGIRQSARRDDDEDSDWD